MSDFLSPILQWINANPELAGLATFIISAAESIAIIGTIVPGTVMMTAIGTLAGAGVMPLWSTVIWAILGAIVGDGISYWIGYYFKDRLPFIWPFRNYPNLLASGQTFFLKHGGKSVFIGRFVGPVRALVPLVAGMLRMEPWRFLVANVTSAIGWAPAYMLPGIALGAASLELPPDIAIHALLMLLLVGLFILFWLWFAHKLFLLIGERINRALTKVWQYLQKSRYFSIITAALKHHHPKKTYGQLTLAFYFLITSSLFIYLATYIYFHKPQTISINLSFLHLFRSFRTPLGETIMLCITLLGDSKVICPLIATLFAWFAWTKRWRTAWHIVALGILTIGCVETFKHLVHSPRPWGIIQSPRGFSFPSGHTTFATAFYFGIALLLVKAFKQKFRQFFYFFAGFLIVAIGLSRIYLGAHWLTDVIGGILLGSALLMLVVLSYNRQPERVIYPLGLISTVLITLTLSYGVYFNYAYLTLKQNHDLIDWPSYSVETDTWWEQKSEHLPLYRSNRFGVPTQLLNLQWIGSLSDISNTLIKNGWSISPKTDWITVLHRVSDVQSAEHLPLVSPLYLDKAPDLVLTKQGNKKLIVLRLWNPSVIVKDSKQPLWVGTVEMVPRTYSWLFKHKRSNDLKLTSQLLFKTDPSSYTIKEIRVKNTHRRKPEKENLILIKPKNI